MGLQLQDLFMVNTAAGLETLSPGGLFFVTLRLKADSCSFGNLVDDKLFLNFIGQTALKSWNSLKNRFPEIHPDEFIVLPDHILGIIELKPANKLSPLQLSSWGASRPGSRLSSDSVDLDTVISFLKNQISNSCQNQGIIDFSWRPGFTSAPLKSPAALKQLRNLIRNYKTVWKLDSNSTPAGVNYKLH